MESWNLKNEVKGYNYQTRGFFKFGFIQKKKKIYKVGNRKWIYVYV